MEAKAQFTSASAAAIARYHEPMDRHGTPRVAFFGGSFDPPHLGHIGVARTAREALHLDTVLFAPVGSQPLKPGGSTATFAERLEMVRLAINADPGFALSMADAPRADGKPNYTVDTLRRLRVELPASGELFCLMGADSLANFRHWYHAAEIPFIATLVVASRPGEGLDDVARLLPEGLEVTPCAEKAGGAMQAFDLRTCRLRNAAGATAPLHVLADVEIPASATEVRTALQSGNDSAMVPPAVMRYIRDRGLYR